MSVCCTVFCETCPSGLIRSIVRSDHKKIQTHKNLLFYVMLMFCFAYISGVSNCNLISLCHDECNPCGEAVHFEDDRREWAGNESVAHGQRDGIYVA